MKIWQLFENFNLAELNANFAELLASVNGAKATYLTANKTVYVATTGSDTTGDGTSGKPYKTIAKGLSVIPKNLNGFDATLFIAGGTYAENVVVKGFHGGLLTIALQGKVTINSFTASSNQFVFITTASVSYTLTITNTTSTAFIVAYAANVRFHSEIVLVVNSATTLSAIQCLSFSQLSIDGTATVNNAGRAISMKANSKAFINSLTGSGNLTGIYGEEGSQFSYGTKTISATTDHVLTGGSIITNLITMP